MRLGIDASNIRAGGGVTHLAELLRAAQPGAQGIDQVVVWAGWRTMAQLREQTAAHLAHELALDGSLLRRLVLRFVLPHHDVTLIRSMWQHTAPAASRECRRLGIPYLGLSRRRT